MGSSFGGIGASDSALGVTIPLVRLREGRFKLGRWSVMDDFGGGGGGGAFFGWMEVGRSMLVCGWRSCCKDLLPFLGEDVLLWMILLLLWLL